MRYPCSSATSLGGIVPPTVGAVRTGDLWRRDRIRASAVRVRSPDSEFALEVSREYTGLLRLSALVRPERDAHIVREAVAEFFKRVHTTTVLASSDVSAYMPSRAPEFRNAP